MAPIDENNMAQVTYFHLTPYLSRSVDYWQNYSHFSGFRGAAPPMMLREAPSSDNSMPLVITFHLILHLSRYTDTNYIYINLEIVIVGDIPPKFIKVTMVCQKK